MALQAHGGLRGAQQTPVRRAMRRMAIRAIFHDGRVFEHFRPADCLVTLETLPGLALQRGMAATVRIMTTSAGHPAFLDRMMGAHLELCTGVLMTFDAHRRIAVRLVGGEAHPFGYGRTVDLMAVATGAAGLAMGTERPVHQFSVIFMATRAVRIRGHLDRRTSLEAGLDIGTRIDMAALAFSMSHGGRRAALHPLVAGKALFPAGMLHQFPDAALLGLFFRFGGSLT